MPLRDEEGVPWRQRAVSARGLVGACLATFVLSAVIPLVTIFVVGSQVSDNVAKNCEQIEAIKTRIRETINASDPRDPQNVTGNPQLAEQVKAMTAEQKAALGAQVDKVRRKFRARACP